MTQSTPAASRFLPSDFDFQSPLAVVAGRGTYPELSIRAAREAGIKVRLVALRGETRQETIGLFDPCHVVSIKVGQIGSLLRAIRGFNARSVLMVGQVRPGRLFRGIHPDFKALRLLRQLKVRNAHSIFGAVVNEIEALGSRVLDARAFLDEAIASNGLILRSHSRADQTSILYGLRVAKDLADLDVGQSIVVRRGTVLAVEGFDGTDGLIEYAGRFPPKGKILIKVAKRGHDFRFDVPVIGPRTVSKMAENGFSHLVIESGNVLLLERDSLLKIARERRITILGSNIEGTGHAV